VIGQEQAKKILSVAVYNHYKRIYHNFLHSAVTAPTEVKIGALTLSSDGNTRIADFDFRLLSNNHRKQQPQG